MSIKLIIDSASDINEKEAQELGITLIPMEINFGATQYLDGVNLLPQEFYEKLIESNVLPKTSQINAYRWQEAFTEALKDNDEVVVITISSKLSGTYNSACNASKEFGGKVHVIDSLNACIGERLLALYALQLIDNKLTASEIEKELNEKKHKINVMAVLGTLEYLKKGGRISSATAIAGKILAIKPVVGVIDGEVKLIGKAMGSKNGNNLLNKIVQEKNGIDFNMPYGTIWSGLDKTMLEKYVAESSDLWQNETDNIPSYILGATIGTHIGPGAVGVAFFEK